MLTGNTGVPGRGLHVFRRGAVLENAVGYSDFLEYFHRALIEHVRLGQLGCMGQRGHQDVANSKLRQQHRRRQASATAADDKYGCFNRHLLSLPGLEFDFRHGGVDAAQTASRT